MSTYAKKLSFAAFAFFLLCGFGAEHSEVQSKATVNGEKIAVEVLVKPKPGMMLTKEGPWSLTLNKLDGLKLESKDGKFTSKAFDEKLPGFLIEAPLDAAVKQGTLEYTVKAFVCTEDKKQCFPQQHKGTIEWKRS